MSRILFVYNADSGPIAGLKDMVHKIVSPETYECNLCGITYGSFGMIGRWRDFIDNLELEVEFLHRDELAEQFGVKDIALPAAFYETDAGSIETWIDAETMNGFDSLDALMEHVADHISSLSQ